MFKIKSPSGFLLTILIITFTMFSCQKEKLDETYLLEEQTVEDLSATLKTNDSCKSKLISIQDEFEQTFYLSQNSKEIFQANFGVIDWDYKSLYCDFFNPDSLIIFPMVSLLNDQDIQSLLVVDKITRASEYSFTIIGKHQFSEVLDNINPESIPESVTQLFEFFNYFSSVDNAATTRCDPGEGCNFNGNWWQRFWGSVGGFFKQIIDGFGSGNSGGGGSNSSGSGNYDIGPYISPYSTTFWNNNPSTGGNNSGGGSSSNSEPTFCTSPSGISFQNIVPLLENLSQFANEFGVSNVDGIPLMDLLQPECINLDYVEFRGCANKSIACHYEVDSEFYTYLSTFFNDYSLSTITTIPELITTLDGDCNFCFSQETFNLWAIGELIRDRGPTPNSGTISVLSGEQQSLVWVLNNIENIEILNSLSDGNTSLTVEERAGAVFFLHSMENNLSALPADDPNLNAALEQFWPGPTIPLLGLDLARQVEQEVLFLRKQHENDPSWTDNWIYAHAIKKVFSGTTHTLLQLCGLFEGPGIFCDGADALFYLMEGDGKNAAISSFAMIPFLGLTAPGQRAVKAITGAAGRKIGLRYTIDAAGVVHFSYRGQLARVIGKVAGHQAHHIIPFAVHSDNPVLQLAARHGWHPNDFINGINLPIARHSGNHPAYTDAVRAKLSEIAMIAGNNGVQNVQLLERFTVNLYTRIQSSTAHINSNTMVQLINDIVIQ